MDKDFDAKVMKASIAFLERQGYEPEVFKGDWLMMQDDSDGDLTTIFIKLMGEQGRFKPYSHSKLRDEFEVIAAAWLAEAWLSGADESQYLGDVRGDVISINAVNDHHALLRWEKGAVSVR